VNHGWSIMLASAQTPAPLWLVEEKESSLAPGRTDAAQGGASAAPFVFAVAVVVAAIFVGLAFWQRGRRARRAQLATHDADVAFQRLARLRKLTRSDRATLVDAADRISAHPVALLVCADARASAFAKVGADCNVGLLAIKGAAQDEILSQ